MGTLEEALSSGDWQGASAAGAMKAESNLHHELKDKGAFDNARYGVESQAKKTAKKIKTQGSVDEAVAVDVKEAGQKASQQKGSVEATQKKAEEIAKKKGISASEVLENTAYKLAGGKLASDVASITEGDKYKNGGYEGLMRDSADIRTKQQVGDTEGRKRFGQKGKGIEDFVQKWINDSEKPEELKKELAESGLLSLDGKGGYKVNPENFIKARAFLTANNMMSHNALAAAGEIAAGSIGDNSSTVKVDGQDSTKQGATYDMSMDKLQKVVAFNMHQKAHGGEQIRYDKKTGKFSMPDTKTAKEFAEFTGDADLIKKTEQNAFSEALAEVADYLGLDSSQVVGGVGGAVVGGVGMGLGVKAYKSVKKSRTNKTNNEHGNPKTDNIDTKHGNSSSDINNYSEEYRKSTEDIKRIFPS
jgi:hypothetical protein